MTEFEIKYKEITHKIQRLKRKQTNTLIKIQSYFTNSGRMQKRFDAMKKVNDQKIVFLKSWNKFIKNTKNQNTLNDEFFLVCKKFYELIIDEEIKKSQSNEITTPLFTEIKKIDEKLVPLNKELKILEKEK